MLYPMESIYRHQSPLDCNSVHMIICLVSLHCKFYSYFLFNTYYLFRMTETLIQNVDTHQVHLVQIQLNEKVIVVEEHNEGQEIV